MTENKKGHSPGARAIQAEHEELRAILRGLQEADLAQVMALLPSLRSHLVEHFETEEGPEGLAAITRRQPQYLGRLDEIFAEHRDFLACVDRITERVHSCLKERKAVLEEVHTLTHDLHEHEAKENELLLDMINTDFG
ncbi:MAG: hypothetical protein HKN12_11950, partial [Gemmatimonadetes bacterium]|nr:hypothetical protein [Gemmatimonadota bacterium]